MTPRSGTIPADLNGRLYRIGPGKFEHGCKTYGHWFDGEGLVSAIDFADGTATAACRFVEPDGAASPTFGQLGRFGTAPEGRWRTLASLWDPSTYVNAANTALLCWNKRLLALFEADLPTEIDPDTLATIGATDLGIIRRAFAAHPKLHRPSGALINQGFRSPLLPRLDYFALEADGRARTLSSVRFSGSLLTHDFAVTDHYIISICSPLFISLTDLFLRGRAISEAARWIPDKGTEILITPVGSKGATKRIVTKAFLFSHTANAFEEDGCIIIHGVVTGADANVSWLQSVRHGAQSLSSSSAGRLTELRINPGTGAFEMRTLADAIIDFPTIDNRLAGIRQTFVYASGFREEQAAYRDLFDVVCKIGLVDGTTTKFDFGDGHFVSEALFVPRHGGTTEDAGWLLCLNYDANADESYVGILNADGPIELVAILPLGQPLPMSFHGLWVDRGGGRCYAQPTSNAAGTSRLT